MKLLALSIHVAASSLVLFGCGDDTTAGSGGAAGTGGASTSSASNGSTSSGSGAGGAGDAVGCELRLCPFGDAQVETCPVGSTCHDAVGCDPTFLCEEGGCEDAALDGPCELTGRRCVVAAGDCDEIVRCDDDDSGPAWIYEGTGECTEG